MNVFEMYFDLVGGKKAGKAAKRESRIQAQQERELTQEKLLNLKIEERTLAGDTRARAAGSHVKVGQGSPLDVLAEQAKTFARESNITARVGATNAAVIRQRGKNVADQAKYGSYGRVSAGLGDAFKLFGGV
jgi:hypothetical protein